MPYLHNEGKNIDVGTGGLPGMVWAICLPKLHLTLLDSITRKCAWTKNRDRNGTEKRNCICKRSERYAKEEREKIHVAAGKGSLRFRILADICALVRIKGKAIAFQGAKVTGNWNLSAQMSALAFHRRLHPTHW